jgi:hypothetical protein
MNPGCTGQRSTAVAECICARSSHGESSGHCSTGWQ